jgi:hypothetical protein
MNNKNYTKTDLTIDLKNVCHDEDHHPPLLRRERNSDYGMFCEHFDYDVQNWFLHIDNKKRIDLIEQLAGLIKQTTIIDTPHPRRKDMICADLPPRLGRQSSIAPSKMESYPEDYEHDEEITPPKIRVPCLTPLQNESNDKFMDDNIFNLNMTRGSQPKNFILSDDEL